MDPVSPNQPTPTIPTVAGPVNVMPAPVTNAAGESTTPMSVATQAVEYAGFGRRFAAVFIDGIVIGTFVGIISVPLALVTGLMSSSSTGTDPNGVSTIANYVSFVVSFCYNIFFIGKKGQTLGKMAMGIKVVKKDNHQTPGFMTAFIREEVGKVLSSLIFGIGYLTMIKDKDKQTWHDKIAGTIVIRTGNS